MSTETTEAPKKKAPKNPGAGAHGVEAEYPAFPDEESARTARSETWFALGMFLAALIAGDALFARSSVGRGLRNETFYLRKPPVFMEDTRGFDVVISGDSRVLHGVDPGAIEQVLAAETGQRLRVFNAGMPGAPPMAQFAWVRRALTHPVRKPRVMVMSLSPYMFSSRIAQVLARESLTTMYRPRDVPSLLQAGAPIDDCFAALNSALWFSARVRPRILEMLTQSSGLRGAAEFDLQGYTRNGEVDPQTQADRARGRALGYRTEMWKPEAHFGNEHQGYFRQALRELRAAGVQAVVLNAPAASQMQLAYGPNSIYDEHIAYVRSTVAEFGGIYFDASQTPAIADEDFNDADHLGGTGASRYSGWLAHKALVARFGGPRALARAGSCRTLYDFESDPLTGWIASGDAFREHTAVQGRRHQFAVAGYTGDRLVNSFARYGGDDAQGTLQSPSFVIDRPYLRLRVGGGLNDGLRVSLTIDGNAVHSAAGHNSETLEDVRWDVRSFQGRTATITITDHAAGPWGHLLVDDVALCDG